MAEKRLRIAMLEDDLDDRYLTNEALAGLGFNLQVDFFTNSQELFDAIRQAKPDLILVDYNSTPENGVQVLKKIKKDEDLCGIPVVILSDTDLPKYRTECYAAGASTYITKPTSMEKTDRKIKLFFTYWNDVAAF